MDSARATLEAVIACAETHAADQRAYWVLALPHSLIMLRRSGLGLAARLRWAAAVCSQGAAAVAGAGVYEPPSMSR